jgi:hypothetical protein
VYGRCSTAVRAFVMFFPDFLIFFPRLPPTGVALPDRSVFDSQL